MASQVVDTGGQTQRSVNPVPPEVVNAADDRFDAAVEAAKTAPPETPAGSPPAETPAVVKAQEAGSTPTPTEARKADDEPAEFKNLLAKYNGDRAAAGKAYWETNNRAAQLAKEKQELEDKLKALEGSKPATPEAPKVEAELIPELQRYDAKILSVENSYKAKHQEYATYSGESKKLDGIIAGLRRQLRSNDISLDRDAIGRQLTDALDAKEQTDQYVAHVQGQLDALDDRWQELQATKDTVKRTIDLERTINSDRQAKVQEQESEYTNSFRSEWNGTIDKVSKDAALIPEHAQARFVKYVKALGKAQVADGVPIGDVASFVNEAAKDFKAGLEEEAARARASYSQGKVADSTLKGPEGKLAIAPETKAPRKDWTQKDWDAYEDSVTL